MVMRVNGLASGMQIDDIVKQMMTSYRAPVNKLTQKLQQIEWQRNDYRSINSQVLDFRNNKLQPLIFSSTYTSLAAKVSGNTSIVTARALDGVVNGTKLNVSVQGLATAASLISGDIGNGESFDANEKLSVSAGLAGSVSFTINDAVITVDAENHSLNDVIKAINSDKDSRVTAFYDSGTRQISVAAKETGAGGIVLDDPDSFLTNVLQMGNVVDGEKARVTINGLAVVRDSNTFQVNGIELNLTEVGESVATVEVKSDTDAVFNTIKQFIEDYNSLLSTIQDKLSETKYRDFLPLSTEQKKEMKENGDDIEAWEEKAMSGMLRGDSILTRAVSDMRSIMTSMVDTGSADINSLASIGIGGLHYSEQGKLHILDEDKLRNAIENDPEAVTKLFNKREASGATVGIAERLYSSMKVTMDNITVKAGVTGATSNTDLIGEQIERLNRQIDEGNQRMLRIETGLYRKFTAMETAIARYSSQSAYLMNAFGGGAPQ